MKTMTRRATNPAAPHPGDWANEGLCNQTDPEAFYAEDQKGQKQASGVCRGCTVRVQCLLDVTGYEDDRDGYWGVAGGLTSLQRRALHVEGLLGHVPNLEQARELAAPHWASLMHRLRDWPADLVAAELRTHGVIAATVTVRVALWWSGAKASMLRPKEDGDRRFQWARVRDESREIVTQLRGMNVSNRDIAAYLGVCEDSVQRAGTAWRRDGLAVAA